MYSKSLNTILLSTTNHSTVRLCHTLLKPTLQMPVPPTPPFRPFAPFPPFGAGFGQFPNFPNFPHFPSFPQIPLPVVPTPDQIKNMNPGQGQMFQGVAVQSSSSMVKDKDGKWVRTGGTSVLTNDNGKVQEFKRKSEIILLLAGTSV